MTTPPALPAWVWAYLIPVRPIRATIETDRLSLWASWLVHKIGLAASMLAWLYLAAWATAPFHWRWSDLWGMWILPLMNLWNDVGPWGFAGIAIAIWLGHELGAAAVALAATAWCARDEPIRASFRRALGRTWRLTLFTLPLVLVVGLVMVWLARMNTHWWHLHGSSHHPYGWDVWPWYVRYQEMLTFLWGSVVTVTWLVLALAALASGAWGARCRWPALCEGCGYTLVGHRRRDDCPECGHPVAWSIAPPQRRGADWERREESGRGMAFVTTAWAALRRPRTFGATLHIFSGRGDPRRFLLLVMLGLFPVMHLAVLLGYLIGERMVSYHPSPLNWSEVLEVTAGGMILAAYAISLAVALLLIVSSVVGSLTSWRAGRNLMPAATQAACYLSPMIYVVVAVYWCLIMLLIVLQQSGGLSRLADAMGMWIDTLVAMTFLGIRLLFLGWYAFWLHRILQGCRHANQ